MDIPKVWMVGRLPTRAHAFDIERGSDGGIKLSRIEHLSDMEKQLVLSHFGTPRHARTGGEREGRLVTEAIEVKPGEQLHFLTSLYRLPAPFKLIGVREV